MNNSDRFDVVPTHLAVEAMRDNGYKNAAYALAELIDNSIQAGASLVELLCCETEEQLTKRRRKRIHQIAVLDDGNGMSADVLRQALQFGNGTRLGDRSGMGRFGMGLPSASISQCRKVDVWSWQNGPESAHHTYLDLGEIESRQQHEVPAPQSRPLPEMWRKAGKQFGHSGTLVVWSELDRLMWRTAAAIINNSEELVGRMYRTFLRDGDVGISLVSFDRDGAPGARTSEKWSRPNDPGYQMVPSSTPPPYDNKPMFQKWGGESGWKIPITIAYDGAEHAVTLKFTYASEEARAKTDNAAAGRTDYGQHAKRNVGVSVMRAGRELDLDQSWVIQYDARERWWGVEIDFPPTLDELFGVTNNKQGARVLADLAQQDIESMLRSRSMAELRDELEADGDPTSSLLEVAQRISNTLSTLRSAIRMQAKASSTSKRDHTGTTAEARATEVTKQRQQEGFKGISDADEGLPVEQRRKEIEEELVSSGYEPGQAKEQAAFTLDNGMKYIFVEGPLEGRNFFSVTPRGGELIIKINTEHPAYNHLVEVLERDSSTNASADERLAEAAEGLKLLLVSWARLEDEQPVASERARLQDTRSDWGRYAARFLERS